MVDKKISPLLETALFISLLLKLIYTFLREISRCDLGNTEDEPK